MCSDCEARKHAAAQRAEREARAASRVGRTERDATIAHLNAAFTKEYLTEEEREERVDKVAQAKYGRDLDAVIADLPSLLQLEGKAAVPKRAWRFTSGLDKMRHSQVTYWLAGLVSAMIAFPLALFIGRMPWLPVSFKFGLVPLAVVLGVAGLVATIATAAKEFKWDF